jgi:SAM-dependent methyltransferase
MNADAMRQPQIDPAKRVLDPCCGSRMMWFDKSNPHAVYGDRRYEQHTLCDGRTLRIAPDIQMDFRALPFDDGTFNLVVFDPPHLKHAGQQSWLRAKYGVLGEDWRDDLRRGFTECFRVLSKDGVLVFKWAEDQIKIRDVLALTLVQPLFGHPTGRKGLTHWYVFMKPAS